MLDRRHVKVELMAVLQAVHEADREQLDVSLPHPRDAADAARGLIFAGKGNERDDRCQGVFKASIMFSPLHDLLTAQQGD